MYSLNIDVALLISCYFLTFPLSPDDSSTLCMMTFRRLLLLSFSSLGKEVITSEVVLLMLKLASARFSTCSFSVHIALWRLRVSL